MLTAFIRAFRTPDLRRKLLFTVFIIAVFRLGSTLPTPGVSQKAINICQAITAGKTGVFQLVNLFSGGSLLKLTVFALGIMPYITASIILQLLAVVIPRLETLRQEGQSTQNLIPNPTPFTIGTMVICMTAGTAVIMWLGELITDRGVGNGMSLMIFTQVIAVIPGEMELIYKNKGTFVFGIVLVVGIAIIAFVALMEQAQRRIPVQYAKRMVGRRMYGGTSTYIPLKVNQAGVIPVIFALRSCTSRSSRRSSSGPTRPRPGCGGSRPTWSPGTNRSTRCCSSCSSSSSPTSTSRSPSIRLRWPTT